MLRKVFLLIIISLAVQSVKAEDAFTVESIARQYRKEGYEAQRKGDLEKAKMFYEKAAAMDPSFAVVYNDLGIIYEAEGAFDKAEQCYLKAIDINPAYLSPYTNMALLCEKEKRWEDAKYFWVQRYLKDPASHNYWRREAKRHVNLLGGDKRVEEMHRQEEMREFMADWEKEKADNEGRHFSQINKGSTKQSGIKSNN